jgi:hypothetical protein
MREIKTVTDNLGIEIDRQLSLLKKLLLEKSRPIIPHPAYLGNSRIVNTSGDHRWSPLDLDGQRLQSKLLEDYRRLFATLFVLLIHQPPDALNSLKQANITILKLINQTGATYLATSQEAFDEGEKAYKSLLVLIARLYDTDRGEIILVPDTNALLYNHQLDKWTFDFAQPFVLFFVPAVLSELDSHKVNHKNESVREKALSLIKQYKEYRSRGDIFEGVSIVNGRSKIAAVALEPEMDHSLPWLKADSNDDRLLASSIEIMRQNPRKPVLLVTRDINLQNKCDYAKVPYVEPPEPIEQN